MSVVVDGGREIGHGNIDANDPKAPLNRAERFLDELRQRLQKFGLELHPQKTRIIELVGQALQRFRAELRDRFHSFERIF
jgi:hypothetical protein